MLSSHSCLHYERFSRINITVHFDMKSSVNLSAILTHFCSHNTYSASYILSSQCYVVQWWWSRETEADILWNSLHTQQVSSLGVSWESWTMGTVMHPSGMPFYFSHPSLPSSKWRNSHSLPWWWLTYRIFRSNMSLVMFFWSLSLWDAL